MRLFSKKSVALIFSAVMLCGMAVFNIANAVNYPASGTVGNSTTGGILEYLPCNGSASDATNENTPNGIACKYNKLIDQTCSGIECTPLISEAKNLLTYYRRAADSDLTPKNASQSDTNLPTAYKYTSSASTADKTYSLPTFSLTKFLFLGGAFSTLVNFILQWLTSLAGWILYLVGVVFDYCLTLSIYDMGKLFSLESINTMWTLIRDTLNIFFIFILLFIAIQKIIGSWGVKAKTTLGNIVISAVFINFSMFVAKLLVDISNVFAIAFFKQIASGNFADSISSAFMAGSGISTTFSSDYWSKILTNSGGDLLVILSQLTQLVMIGFAIWLLVWGCYIFIGRTVLLIFYTITSPIAFVGGVMPRLKKEASDWWSGFINQLLVAPIFLFFMLIIISILNDDGFKKMVSPLNAAGNGLDVLLMYFLLVYFMKIAFDETKKMSGKLGEIAVGAAKVTLAAAGVAATGGAGLAAGGLGTLGAKMAGGATTGFMGGVGRVSGAMTSFANLSKKTLTNVATGKAGDQSGIMGQAARGISGNLMEGLKGATSGNVDIQKMRKSMEEEKQRIYKEDVALEKELKDKREKLEATDKVIAKRAQEAAEKSTNLKKDDVEKENRGDKREVEKANRVEQEARGEIESFVITNPGQPIPTDMQDRHNQATNRLNKATAELNESTARLQKFQKELRRQYDSIATEMGTSTEEIARELLEANNIGPEIKKSQVDRIKLGIAIKRQRGDAKTIMERLRRYAFTKKQTETEAQQLFKGTDEEKDKK